MSCNFKGRRQVALFNAVVAKTCDTMSSTYRLTNRPTGVVQPSKYFSGRSSSASEGDHG